MKELESVTQKKELPISFTSNDFADPRLEIAAISPGEGILVANNIPDLFETYFSDISSLDSTQRLKDTIKYFEDYLESISIIAKARELEVYFLEPIFLHQKLYPSSRQDLIYKNIYLQFRKCFLEFFNRHTDNKYIKAMTLKESFDCVSNPDFFSERTNNVFGLPLTQKAIRLLSADILDYLHSQFSYFPKLIVVDCDNTLWKGVIGEDFADDFGKHHAIDQYYKLFQKQLKFLKSKGVLLSICSKNNERDLRSFFQSREDFPLKPDDFVCFESNWDSKVEMMQRVLAQVNVLPSSVLFIDDSDFEIANMQSFFPEITSVQVPKRIEDLPNVLSRIVTRLFDEVTAEDLTRNDSLRFEEKRLNLKSSTDFSSFLKSLCLELTIFNVKSNQDSSFGRVLQLINKTSQFNFTTRRETHHSLSQFLKHQGKLFACSLKDNFGDYGIVGVLMIGCEDNSTSFSVSNYLISCRALGRGVEMAFLKEVVMILEETGASSVSMTLEVNPKNLPAQSFFTSIATQDPANKIVPFASVTQELLGNALLIRQKEIDIRRS